MNMGDAMLLGRGRCREGVAEHDCGGKRNFYLAQHFLSPGRTSRHWPLVAADTGRDCKCRRHHKALYEGHLSGSAEHILSSSELGTKAREPFWWLLILWCFSWWTEIDGPLWEALANAGGAMVMAAIAAPKISFETFAMISSPRVDTLFLTRRRLDYIAANSITLSWMCQSALPPTNNTVRMGEGASADHGDGKRRNATKHSAEEI
jgi:hypothetical protein